MSFADYQGPVQGLDNRPMKVLAFDTSTEALSVAVGRWQGGALQLWQHSGPGGAQASATLIPCAMALLAQAGLTLQELDAVAFGAGPGSFTGLRTACAVAQGLAYGAGVPVLPVDTLLAVAEDARHSHGVTQVQVVLDARMDEVYTAAWAHDGLQWHAHGGAALSAPQDVPVQPGWTLAGNAFTAYGERLPLAGARVDALPTAEAMLRLAPALLAAGQAVAADQALPRYIRDKVAKTTDERAAERAARPVT
jgi:tRNA threonylcarbamoyladenosine biosynthesis protein TsaB